MSSSPKLYPTQRHAVDQEPGGDQRKHSSPLPPPQRLLLLTALLLLACVASGAGQGGGQRCPDKCLCFRTTVRCMFVHRSSIPTVASHTTILDLRFNKIRTIPPGSFRSMPRLNTLLLNNNHITRLQNGAFEGLDHLRYLYLYKNRIRHIDRDVFKDLNNLEQLYLHFNDISSFEADTFSSLPSLQRLFLHNNRLQRVPIGAFRNLQSLRRLRLDSNALVCDCQLLWLAKMVKEKQDSTLVAATCEQPLDLHGKSIMSLTDTEFQCVGMPQIMEEPQDVEVSFGGTATFTCRVEGDPAPRVLWFHNNEVISPAEPRHSVATDGTLSIHNAQDADVGYYECRASNPRGQAVSRKATVSMTVHQPPTRPQLAEAPQDVNVTEGHSVELPCNATGHPRPDIVWLLGNQALRFDARMQVTPSGSLLFQAVVRGDEGTYTCTASNPLGAVHASAAITVIAPVHFTGEPADQYVGEGETAQFSCRAEGRPKPELTWLRHDTPLRNSATVSVSIGGESIRLLNVQKSDEGEYVCRADNGAYVNEVAANLYIRDTLAPVLMTEPRDQTATPGANVTMPCTASGRPLPVIVWRKDGHVMAQRTHTYNVSSTGSLQMFNVTVQDAGMYECSARNTVGYVSARAALTVIEEPRTRLGDPFFRESFLEASRQVNRAVNMTVSQLFRRREGARGGVPAPPHELLRVFRFPQAEAREIARAAEQVEHTLQVVLSHVEAGMVFNLTDFSYQDLLSPENLELLNNLSGCLVHRRSVACNDMCFHLKYRTIDGTCNNLDNPMWGSSLTGFKRLLPPIYENGFNTPVGWSKVKVYYGYFKPSPRLVSTEIMSNEASSPDDICTHMLMQWGQFLDHDIDHALPSISTESFADGQDCQSSCEYSAPCFPIEVPRDDPRVHRHRCMGFTRSSAVCGSGATSVFFNTVLPREQINQLTSYIDASQVYGSSYPETQQLRNFTENRGDLRIGISVPPSGKPLMPFSARVPIDCRRDLSESAIDCFLAGDVRANEQTALLAMHTVWFREHNRVAAELRRINPHWDGDTVFHETRKILGAVMQHITYKHWLPRVLGPATTSRLGPYRGYDPTVEATVANVFATAAFRFGHSLVNPVLQRLNATFQPIRHGHLPLHQAFFSPWRLVQEGGVDPLLRGLFATPVKLKLPGQILNTELTEKLFRAAHEVALDLAAINIQRGRDHALPGYVEWRQFCNLSVPQSFDDLKDDITSAAVREKLQHIYGHPGNVDVWVGALLEDVLEGAKVGPTIACILLNQFTRLRDGDRFWYENPTTFKPDQLLQIRRMTLGRVLCDNGDAITDVTRDVFVLPHTQTPAFVACATLPKLDLRFWSECCKDCRNAGYFNSLIRTPGLRLRRSVEEHSYKEEREDILSGNFSPNTTQFNTNDHLNGHHHELVHHISEINHLNIESNYQYGFKPDDSSFNGDSNRRYGFKPDNSAFNSESNYQYGFKPDDSVMNGDNKDLNELMLKRGEETVHEVKKRSGVADSEENVVDMASGSRGRGPQRRQRINDRFLSLSSTRGASPDPIAGYQLDATEQRIEGVEAVVEQLLNAVRELTQKVDRLQRTMAQRRRLSRTVACTDAAGKRRRFRESWYLDKCTRCTCRRKGKRCHVISCPSLACERQVTREDVCCPVCDDSAAGAEERLLGLPIN